MEIDCFVPQELSIQPDILAVILGNCLDNSIAACLRLPNKERSLSINIRYFQQNLLSILEIILMRKKNLLVSLVKRWLGLQKYRCSC